MLRELARTLAPVVSAATRRRARRQLPDLGRLAASPRFRAVDAAATALIDENFRRIEAAAPWLARVGTTTLDSCRTGTSPQGVMHRGIFAVTCERSVASVYACDGPLDARLGQLAAALTAAGWTDARLGRGEQEPGMVSLAGREPPARATLAGLDPVSDMSGGEIPGSTSPGMRSLPPRARSILQVSWAGREDPADRVAALIAIEPHQGDVTDLYLPVHVERPSADELVSRAIRHGQNAIAIRVTIVYYHAGGIKWAARDWP